MATVTWCLRLELNTERYWFTEIDMIYQFKTRRSTHISKLITFKGQGLRRWFLLHRVDVYHFIIDPGRRSAKNRKKTRGEHFKGWFKRVESCIHGKIQCKTYVERQLGDDSNWNYWNIFQDYWNIFPTSPWEISHRPMIAFWCQLATVTCCTNWTFVRFEI